MNKIYCRPKWYGRSADGEYLFSAIEAHKYLVFKVSKDSEELKEIFTPKYLSMLKDDFIWKIYTSGQTIYRCNESFLDEFDIVT